MTIHFDCSSDKIVLFHDGVKLMESRRNGKLQLTAKDFIPKFRGTKVEDIPKGISFYIGNAQDAYPSLSAISIDNTDDGIILRLMTNDIDLNSWRGPFSFDDYINKLESSINDIITPIQKFYRTDYKSRINYTVLALDFRLKIGDVMEVISKYVDEYLCAQNEVNKTLLREFSSDKLNPGRKCKFVDGEHCSMEEDLFTEFKEIKGDDPCNSIKNKIIEYTVAFLNGSGGSIFWGIKDDGIVKSITLSSKLKDSIKLIISSGINTIQPSIDPTKIKIFFHEVSNVIDGYVLEVSIPKLNDEMVYFNSAGNSWVRLDGNNQKIKGPALYEFICQRTKNK